MAGPAAQRLRNSPVRLVVNDVWSSSAPYSAIRNGSFLGHLADKQDRRVPPDAPVMDAGLFIAVVTPIAFPVGLTARTEILNLLQMFKTVRRRDSFGCVSSLALQGARAIASPPLRPYRSDGSHQLVMLGGRLWLEARSEAVAGSTDPTARRPPRSHSSCGRFSPSLRSQDFLGAIEHPTGRYPSADLSPPSPRVAGAGGRQTAQLAV
jgi:hypothetical protein